MLNSNLSIAIASGLGLAFVGYCVYFDRKRRSHPDFKKNLIEKRRRQKEERDKKESAKYPDLTDEIAVQKFFMTELAQGEQMLGQGEVEVAVEHFANAVAVSPRKEHMLGVFKTSLPDSIFGLMMEKLPEVSKKICESHQQKSGNIKQTLVKAGGDFGVEISKETLAVDDLLD